MKKSLLGLAVAATMSVTAFTAQAEDMYRGAWYAVPGVSVLNTDNDLEAEDRGAGAFLKIGKEISQHWDIQGGIGRTHAGEDTGIAGAGGEYKQTTLGLDALYMFSRDQFRPFLLAGIGAARNNVDYTAPNLNISDKKTSWLANVGIGAQILFNDTFGFQADLRHQWTRADTKVENGVVVDNGNERIGNTLFNLGGIFRFGAPAPAPVMEPMPEPAPVAFEPEPLPEIAPIPEPAPAPEPAPIVCEPTMETITIAAEELFGFDRANLKADGRAALDEAANKLKANPDIELVMVTGHTDRIGSAAYNQRLSERRANQVKDYLVSQGVEASRLQAVGMGETQPIVECAGVRGKAAVQCLQPNRRVELSAQTTRQLGCM
jgi:OOP family OmpA-OmpF porin